MKRRGYLALFAGVLAGCQSGPEPEATPSATRSATPADTPTAERTPTGTPTATATDAPTGTATEQPTEAETPPSDPDEARAWDLNNRAVEIIDDTLEEYRSQAGAGAESILAVDSAVRGFPSDSLARRFRTAKSKASAAMDLSDGEQATRAEALARAATALIHVAGTDNALIAASDKLTQARDKLYASLGSGYRGVDDSVDKAESERRLAVNGASAGDFAELALSGAEFTEKLAGQKAQLSGFRTLLEAYPVFDAALGAFRTAKDRYESGAYGEALDAFRRSKNRFDELLSTLDREFHDSLSTHVRHPTCVGEAMREAADHYERASLAGDDSQEVREEAEREAEAALGECDIVERIQGV